MKLNELTKLDINKSKGKRKGRGIGSGKGGHTIGRGTKGQKSRSSRGMPFGFEGGQVPLYKKMPQIGGFRNPTTKKIGHISLSDLNRFRDGSKVTLEDLIEKKLFKKLPKDGVKILSNGEIEKKLTLVGFQMSAPARIKLEKAGCKIE